MKRNAVIVLLMCCLLTACSKFEDPKFTPQLNPTPQYYITYQGFIDPSLNKLVHLTILTVYATTNDTCRKTVNSLEGVTAPREQLHYTDVKPDEQGHFSYKVPLDKYFPGDCGWKPSGAFLAKRKNLSRDKYSALEWFADNKKSIVNIDQEYINWACTNTECHSTSGNAIVYQSKSISSNQNHTFELNFYRENI